MTAEERIRAADRVRAILLDLGSTAEEVDAAIADETVDLLMVDRTLMPSEVRMTQAQIVELTGIPTDLIRRIWRALGFADVGDDEPAFTDMDVDAIRLFQSMMAMGLVDQESGLQMARVIGLSMARIAEAETSPGTLPILLPTGDSLVDAEEFARRSGESIPTMGRLLEYVWRRHLQAATRRAMRIRLDGDAADISPVMAVGFADMVGFAALSQQLGDHQLAEVVLHFEELAHDIVTSLGGRVVKMIGDEVMFVAPGVSEAADIGLTLAESYAEDALLSDVRVGLSVGPVLVQDGDFYGPVVNLASRLVGTAHPGTVLASDTFRSALEEEAPSEFALSSLRPRHIKDLGRVQTWRLTRPAIRPPAGRRRVARWERLGEVLRQLDHVSATDRGGGSFDRGSVEPDRSDAVSPQLEAVLEGEERSAP